MHVHNASPSTMIAGMNSDNNNNRSLDSLDSLELNHESRDVSARTMLGTERDSSQSASVDTDVVATPRIVDPLLLLLQPLGLRQRHQSKSNSGLATQQQQKQQSEQFSQRKSPFVCDTPTRRSHDILGGFDSMSHQNNTILCHIPNNVQTSTAIIVTAD